MLDCWVAKPPLFTIYRQIWLPHTIFHAEWISKTYECVDPHFVSRDLSPCTPQPQEKFHLRVCQMHYNSSSRVRIQFTRKYFWRHWRVKHVAVRLTEKQSPAWRSTSELVCRWDPLQRLRQTFHRLDPAVRHRIWLANRQFLPPSLPLTILFGLNNQIVW